MMLLSVQSTHRHEEEDVVGACDDVCVRSAKDQGATLSARASAPLSPVRPRVGGGGGSEHKAPRAAHRQASTAQPPQGRGSTKHQALIMSPNWPFCASKPPMRACVRPCISGDAPGQGRGRRCGGGGGASLSARCQPVGPSPAPAAGGLKRAAQLCRMPHPTPPHAIGSTAWGQPPHAPGWYCSASVTLAAFSAKSTSMHLAGQCVRGAQVTWVWCGAAGTRRRHHTQAHMAARMHAAQLQASTRLTHRWVRTRPSPGPLRPGLWQGRWGQGGRAGGDAGVEPCNGGPGAAPLAHSCCTLCCTTLP